MEKCIGCELCAGVCPARCIYVRGADNPPDDPVSPGERYGFVYEINYLRCIHCDLCVEACPTEAITETKLFEFSFTNRARRDLHQGRAARRRRRPAPAAAVGGLAAGRGRRTPRPGCAPPRRRATPPTRAGSAGRASSATACAPPSAARPTTTPAGRPTSRRSATTAASSTATTTDTGGTDRGSRHLPRLRGHRARSAPLGVVLSRNPVHSALSLVATLFGIAVLFLAQDAQFLAAVQVIVYAGAIVVLFLFVIMLLGVDQRRGPRRSSRSSGQRAGRVVGRPACCSVAGAPARRSLIGGSATSSPVRTVDRRQASTPDDGQRRPARPVALHRLPLRRSRSPSVLLVDRRRRRGRARPPPSRRQPLDEPSRSTSPTTSDADADDRGAPLMRARPRPGLPGRSARCCSPSAPVGLLVRRNPLVMFMCVELMLNAVNLTFVTFARELNDIGGQVDRVLRAGGRGGRGRGRPRHHRGHPPPPPGRHRRRHLGAEGLGPRPMRRSRLADPALPAGSASLLLAAVRQARSASRWPGWLATAAWSAARSSPSVVVFVGLLRPARASTVTRQALFTWIPAGGFQRRRRLPRSTRCRSRCACSSPASAR